MAWEEWTFEDQEWLIPRLFYYGQIIYFHCLFLFLFVFFLIQRKNKTFCPLSVAQIALSVTGIIWCYYNLLHESAVDNCETASQTTGSQLTTKLKSSKRLRVIIVENRWCFFCRRIQAGRRIQTGRLTLKALKKKFSKADALYDLFFSFVCVCLKIKQK